MHPLPLSVLDLAVVGTGDTSTSALRATTELARAAEALGYTRFWVAEHHNMPAVASTSPAVLAAHVAASTSRIRVGSGGVMLPNHAPLVVAEQFALLEALHPGRIDLGVGRAPGTDPATAAALRRTPNLEAESFPQDLCEVLDLLGHAAAPRRGRGLAATPAATSSPDVVLLGSSGFSAQLAGMLGLPFAFAHHFAGQHTVPAVQLYREHFSPSPALAEPYVIITAGVIAAPTRGEAEHLAGPSELLRLSLRTGRLTPLLTTAEAAAHPQREIARAAPSTQIVGAPDEVVAQLHDLAAGTGADELMISTTVHDLEDRRRSLALLAEAWAEQPVSVPLRKTPL